MRTEVSDHKDIANARVLHEMHPSTAIAARYGVDIEEHLNAFHDRAYPAEPWPTYEELYAFHKGLHKEDG